MKNEKMNANGSNRNNGNRSTDRQSAIADGVQRLNEKEWMRSAVAKAAVDDWWSKLSPGQRMLAQVIARMIEEVTESKRVEIRMESGAVRARFIHLLNRPEEGCLSAIVLPEAPSGGCN